MFDEIGESKVDISRQKTKGFPETIYGLHKTPQQIIDVIDSLRHHGQAVLASRVRPEKAEIILKARPDLSYHEAAQIIHFGQCPSYEYGKIVIVSGGTSDYPVASEAELTAKWMGCQVELIMDVGVAGLHRLLSYTDHLKNADVIIAVAGMEGALASVVSGLVDVPVIAVPTSVGYGSNLQGVTTLLAMITSCSSGISVVNIDNGYGAAYQAALILRKLNQKIKEVQA